MIQCVGSRDKDRPNCSRTCCATAVKNALKIKELNPGTEVTVLTATYGRTAEPYYAKAREQGVLFVRYEPEENLKSERMGKSWRSRIWIRLSRRRSM